MQSYLKGTHRYAAHQHTDYSNHPPGANTEGCKLDLPQQVKVPLHRHGFKGTRHNQVKMAIKHTSPNAFFQLMDRPYTKQRVECEQQPDCSTDGVISHATVYSLQTFVAKLRKTG